MIDNHTVPYSSLKPQDFGTNWLYPDKCPDCPARRWCYAISPAPETQAEKVEQLKTIFSCYLLTYEKAEIEPLLLCHAPLPTAFEQFFADRYGKPFQDCRLVMPQNDFPVFLEAATSIQPAHLVGVEFDQLPARFVDSTPTLQWVAKNYPTIIRVMSVHYPEIGGEILRLGRQDGELERTLDVYRQLGPEAFWIAVWEATLSSLTSEVDILGHAFAWQKHLDACPDTDATQKIIQAVAQKMAQLGIIADLNASGMKKGKHRDNPYFPARWIPVFQQAGVGFTAGDDSHNQRQIGRGFDDLLQFCLRNGITELVQTSGQRNSSGRLEWQPVKLTGDE
ncbi:hypothetical protein KKF61_06745 [Patescibacteria group bacterium]|nr:hypothetical protein [Patescibacteria group bacterium]